MEEDSLQGQKTDSKGELSQLTPTERRRLMVHLGRMFSGQYGMEVIPSGQKGLWACSLNPKILPELNRYIDGQRDTLDDLPEDSFTPSQLLFDEESLAGMDLAQVVPIMRHEGGHAKRTNFKDMIYGQRRAKDEGHLPTTFWTLYEGMEDPRVNTLEGMVSPEVDRQIREAMSVELDKRLTESPLKNRPLPVQFAYNAYYQWLHGETIPELKGTPVWDVCEKVKPLMDEYFQCTDKARITEISRQVWDTAKVLGDKEQEQEQLRQTADRQNQQSGSGGTGSGQSGQEGIAPSKESGQEANSSSNSSGPEWLKRLTTIFNRSQGKDSKEQSGNQVPSPAKPRPDLTKLTPEQIRDLQQAFDNLPEKEKQEIIRAAREEIDRIQKEELKDHLPKMFSLEKNKQGEYEAAPNLADGKQQKTSSSEFHEAEKEIDELESSESEEAQIQHDQDVREQREYINQLIEKEQMQKAGFDEDERDKFLLYQSLENGMLHLVRRFIQNAADFLPRKLTTVSRDGYYTGPKINRRDLAKRLPVRDERIHERPHLIPEGDPSLFIALVIDNTGSMAGTKIDQARMSTIFLAKVCRELRIPFMATAFEEAAQLIKSFRQDFENPREKIKPKLIDATNAEGSATNLHDGLEITVKAMREEQRLRPDSHGLIIVITDGGANTGLIGDELREYIRNNKGRLTVLVIGLSENKSERSEIKKVLDDYFGERSAVYPENFTELPQHVYSLLRENLIRFKSHLN